jgi:hypothetical protein
MVYTIYYNPFNFLASIKFGYELVNQKMFEMKIEKMAHFTHFIILHLKLIVVKMLICHIFVLIAMKKPICDMIIIKIFTWFINLFQSCAITMFSKYYKFHKH